MPFSILSIPDVHNAISRPVNTAMIRQFMAYCNIPKVDVRFPGFAENVPLTQSTLGQYHSAPRLPTDARLEISVDEVYSDDSMLNTPILSRDQPFYLLDSATRIGVKPGYSRVRSTITVKYVAPDQLTANRWRNTIRQMALRGQTLFNATVQYHYDLPEALVDILRTFHGQIEAVAGYNQTFVQWLKKNTRPNMGFDFTLDGEEMSLMVRETQNNIWGSPEFMMDPPKPEKSNDAGAYSVDFSMSFQYQRCDWCILHYPMVIHNQLVDSELLAHRVNEPFPQLPEARLSQTMQMVRFMEQFGAPNHPDIGITGIPTNRCDDWLCPSHRKAMKNLLRILLTVDLGHPRELVNLHHMGEFTFSADALAYLSIRPKACTVAYDSVFYFRLFKWDDPLPSESLSVSQGLSMAYTHDLDPRQNYRLVVDMVMDPTMLSDEALRDLNRVPGFLEEYKKAIGIGIKDPLYTVDDRDVELRQANFQIIGYREI